MEIETAGRGNGDRDEGDGDTEGVLVCWWEEAGR